MEKEQTKPIELLKATRDNISSLYDRVHNAGMQSSFVEGRYHHEIAHGLDIQLGFASGYFKRVVEVVGNPEAGRSYSRLRPFKRARAIAAAIAAEKALSSLPMDKVQEVYDKATEALNSDLEGSVAHYADALSNKKGQKMTEEDTAKMQAVLRVMEVLMAHQEVQKAYQPSES